MPFAIGAGERVGSIGKWLVTGFLGLTISAHTLLAGDQQRVRRGLVIAQQACSPCHAIGRSDASPTRINVNTALRDLHRRYPIAMLVTAARTGVIAGHDEMPEFRLSPSAARDLLVYIDSLSPDDAPKYTRGRP